MYDGNVTVGGEPQTRELDGLTITKVAVGPMNNNAYILSSMREVLLIDAANDASTILALLPEGRLDTVVTTHQHWDHWQALQQVVDMTDPVSAAHPLDAEPLPVVPTLLMEDGDVVAIGSERLTAIHLVGHTPGSIALLWSSPTSGDHLFTGDCLFPGGPGNTQKDPVRFTTLMDGLEAKVFGVLPDSTWVYPGHGADTTLGAERPHLAQWRARGW